MGLTSSLYTALSGLNASQQRLDVTGNNIANVNTVAFKGSRTVFETQLSQTMSGGTPPSDVSGGTNPTQLGLGTMLGAVQRDMTGGSIDTTGINTDIAIQGSGFFALQDAGGGRVYTRDGAFTLDPNQKLVNTDGKYVLGYPVDQNFNIQAGTPTPLTIPMGKRTISKATTNTIFAGNLDNSGTPAVSPPGTAVSSGLVSKTTGLPATGATLLTDLATASAPGVNIFAANNIITLSPMKGTRTLKPATLTVGAASTVNDLMTVMQNASGLDTTAPQVPPAGVSIGADGKITVAGNLGTDNDIKMGLTSNGAVPNPLIWTTTAGTGSSEHTAFLAYDSLGNPVHVDLTFTMDQKTTTGTTWRFIAESAESSNPSPFLGSGTVTFDTNGNFANATGTNLIINRASTGSVDPITFNMDLSALSGRTLVGDSSVTLTTQDGYSAGTLNDFSIGQDGIITGNFSNGLSRNLGQVLVADFTNPEGLIAQGNNNFIAGPNSGEANIVTPGSMGAGTLIGGALELSNVDVTQEFINMVTATTAFSAAGKVISTSNQLLNELLAMMR
jgi:flagellar hook protein FlgE